MDDKRNKNISNDEKDNDNLIFSLSIAMLFTACGGRSSQTDENQSVTGIDSAWVHVTQTQFDAMGMQLDTIREVSFSEKLRVNGYILSSVNGQAQVTSRLRALSAISSLNRVILPLQAARSAP